VGVVGVLRQRPRQNGKGGIIEARELWGLFIGGEKLILHSAHEFKTAKEAMRRIEELLVSSAVALTCTNA
jgi:hypothetical protein